MPQRTEIHRLLPADAAITGFKLESMIAAVTEDIAKRMPTVVKRA